MSTPLTCPTCQSIVEAEGINIQKLIAKCAQCNTVFNFENREPSAQPMERLDIPLPDGFLVEHYSSEMIIKIIWRKTRHLSFYIIFTVFWNLITLPFVILAISSADWMLALMISLHVAVGIGFLLYTLALLMNTTSFDVSTHGIAIVTNPIRVPLNPNRYLKSNELEQLYIDKYVASKTNGRPNYAYAVHAVVKGADKHLKLIKGLKNKNQALFIEHEVEKFLNIENKEVH